MAPRGPAEEPPLPGWPLPQLVSLFLPEFPVRPSARQQQLKVPSGSPHPPNGVPVHPNGVPDRPPPGASCPCIPPLAPCTVSLLVLPGFLHVSTGVPQRPEHPPAPSVHPVPPSRHRRLPYRPLLARSAGSLRIPPPSPAVPPCPLLSPPCARVGSRCVLPGFLCTPPERGIPPRSRLYSRGSCAFCQNPPLPRWGPRVPVPRVPYWVPVNPAGVPTGSSRFRCVPCVHFGCSVPLTSPHAGPPA